jgi:predicted Rossmann-fold nucleotide-binding protein
MHLVLHNDGMIVLPGGIGTLSEMALAWSLMQVGDIGKRPFILYGPTWKRALETFFDGDYIKEQDYSLLQFAETPEAAGSAVDSLTVDSWELGMRCFLKLGGSLTDR